MYRKLLLNIVIITAFLIFAILNKDFLYSNSKYGISIGSKNFTESRIVAEIYSQVLENSGYKVNRKFNLGGTLIAHESLKNGEIDLYPEYTGTSLIIILKHKPIADKNKVYAIVSSEYKKNWNLIWLKPSEVNDSQGIVVTDKVAKKYNIYTISRLQKMAPTLRFASIPEFEEREDGLKGLNKKYGTFNFKSLQMFDNGIK